MNAKILEAAQERACEKVKVFENPQDREIQDEREDEPLLPVGVRAAGFDLLCDQEIHRGAANHEREETPIPPSVEKVAGQEKENILGAVLETPVQQHDWYQEEKISRGVKEHGVKLTQCSHVFRSEPHAHKDMQTNMEGTIS